MSGAPPQQELFDYKPALVQLNMQPCPDQLLEVLKKERLAFIDLKARRPKVLGTPYKFAPRGNAGHPGQRTAPRHLGGHRRPDGHSFDVHGSVQPRACRAVSAHRLASLRGASIGSWATWGLGSENDNLPGFVVLVSGGTDPTAGKSLWGSGFLPSVYQGVQCRTVGEPILFAANPPGMDTAVRRRSLDVLRQLNELELAQFGDPETLTRINQYELAFRMQMAVPEVMDVTREPEQVQKDYGVEPGKESFANNCLLARRLLEQGVRYVQLFDWGWDFHGSQRRHGHRPRLTGQVPPDRQADCRTDQGSQAAWPFRRYADRLGRRIRPHTAE